MTNERLMQYLTAFRFLEKESDILKYLPSGDFPNYKSLIDKIINFLKNNLDFYESYPDSDAVLDLIDKEKKKINICEGYLMSINNEYLEEDLYFDSKKPRNLVFASMFGGSNYFLDDLKNIEKRYHESFYEILSSICLGCDSNIVGDAKFKSKINGIYTKKGTKVRIDYKFLDYDTIYIIGARVVKRKGSRKDAIEREVVTLSEYNELKLLFTDNERKNRFLEKSLLDIQEVWDSFLKEDAKKYVK